jgi:hypothetical protein
MGLMSTFPAGIILVANARPWLIRQAHAQKWLAAQPNMDQSPNREIGQDLGPGGITKRNFTRLKSARPLSVIDSSFPGLFRAGSASFASRNSPPSSKWNSATIKSFVNNYCNKLLQISRSGH